jgi:dTDP-4-dehydrorhamnose reductase
MKMSPVWMDDLIEFLLKYLEKPEKGVFHVSALDEITYYEAAQYIVRKLRLDINKVEPISAKSINIEYIPYFISLSTQSNSVIKFNYNSYYHAIDKFLNFKKINNKELNKY